MSESTAPRSAGPTTVPAAPAANHPERSSASLLVRCWLEPGAAGEPPSLRGYVKNLKTGEELFIKDLESVGDQLRRQLVTAGADADADPNRSLAEGAG
jgi:hypothetical protein